MGGGWGLGVVVGGPDPEDPSESSCGWGQSQLMVKNSHIYSFSIHLLIVFSYVFLQF